ncbi:Uncharacterised protein [Lysinibacillus capsici]|uniref:Uncharacterized protein n=1 Tax=Lysinibacillus capsici TaxID=2115968 RepID=A0A2X0YSZ7_9BACI|nr:hypothetical protein [Lysinibacillus capsici]SPT98407.1 Uncharacterised protein [Lysinibacillus capsici]
MKYKVLLWYPTLDFGFEKVVSDVKYIRNNGVEYELANENEDALLVAPCDRVVYIERVDD